MKTINQSNHCYRFRKLKLKLINLKFEKLYKKILADNEIKIDEKIKFKNALDLFNECINNLNKI